MKSSSVVFGIWLYSFAYKINRIFMKWQWRDYMGIWCLHQYRSMDMWSVIFQEDFTSYLNFIFGRHGSYMCGLQHSFFVSSKTSGFLCTFVYTICLFLLSSKPNFWKSDSKNRFLWQLKTTRRRKIVHLLLKLGN